METLMATVVFIPLSIFIVEAAFSATVYPTTILGNLAPLRSGNYARERGDHHPKLIQNKDFTDQSLHHNPVTACTTEDCEGRYKYNSCSTTYEENCTGMLFEYSCFIGEKFLSQDTLHVAGLETKDQLFHELPDVRQTWTVPYTTYFDAVLGLVPSIEQSLANIPSYFQNMISQGLPESNIASFAFSSSGMGWSYLGEITYGGIYHDQYVGNLKHGPLSNITNPNCGPNYPLVEGPPILNRIWRVEARTPLWGNSMDESYDLSDFMAKFDTAEFFISLPWAAYRQLYDIIPLEPVTLPEGNLVDCERRDDLPKLTFLLGDHNFTILGYQYTLEMITGGYKRVCILGIEPRPFDEAEDEGVIVLGTGFLRGFYSVFDYGEE
jgi:saccharopepsin